MKNPATTKATATATSTATSTTTRRNSNMGSKTPCCSKVGVKRGPWTPEEDEILSSYIKKEGEGRWRTLPNRAGLRRCGKSCRLRWMNYLRPSVKRGQIAPDEEDLILRLHRLLGNRWSLIAGRIPGRTDNEIKNYWNTHLSKKLISQGIDPRTHKPLKPGPAHAHAHHQHPPAHLLKAAASSPSSSKINRATATIPQPNINDIPAAASIDQMMMSTESDADKQNDYFQNHYQTDHDHDHEEPAIGHGFTDLLNFDSCTGIEMKQNQGGIISSNEEDEDINYCTDDVFSSFLNSLINDDAFTNQNQADASVSVNTTTLGLGQDWESPIMSTNFNQNETPKRVNTHHLN